MADKSWIARFIETEFVDTIGLMDDIIADGRIESMTDEEVIESFKDAQDVARRIQFLGDCFASCKYVYEALFGERRIPGLYERYQDDFDALLLYGHDGHNAAYTAGIACNLGGNPRGGYGILHNLASTIHTMAFLVSGDERHLHELNSKSSIEVVVQSAEECEVDVCGNVERFDNSMYTILLNLTKNAEENKAGRVSIELSDATPQYKVRDDGSGIPQDKLPLIFGKYSSSDRGLGLRIVKRIVDLRGGCISVDSTEANEPTYQYNTQSGRISQVSQQDRGTIFSIYLP